MKKINTSLNDIRLVGLTVRTNNKKLFEADPSTNVIAATVQKYFHEGWANKIQNRKKPGTTYCVYTEYESDFNGDFTYLIGEEVDSIDDMDTEFKSITIPAQSYAKFTNQPGPMPNVCIDMWQNIWKMSASQFGGERSYIADFEVYDERSADHTNVELDIYIGINRPLA